MLAGVEGAGPRPLHFSDYHIRNSSYRASRAQDEPYPIIEVTYSRSLTDSEQEFAATQGLDDFWEIRVHPVPSAHRAHVRACLVHSGLARLRGWLGETRIRKGGQGRGFCRVLYHEGCERLVIEQRPTDFGDPSSTEIECGAEKETRDNNKMQQTRRG